MKTNTWILLVLLLFSYTSGEATEENDGAKKIVRVAVIGAGVGGTSVPYFLSEDKDEGVTFEVDVFEKSERVGGRLETVEINGKFYETGGSILHPRNKYASELVKKLGLKKIADHDDSTFGILKDNKVIFRSSTWKLMTMVRVLWRYGLSFEYLYAYTDYLVDEISRIYTLQKRKMSFYTTEEMLGELSHTLLNLTQVSYESFLKNTFYNPTFVNEIVQAITYVNYGQSLDVHALVGSVAFAGSGGGLWSIQNGNKQLPMAMLRASNAKVFLKSGVTSISKIENDKYRLEVDGQMPEGKKLEYDAVVIATPLEVGPIQFVNFTQDPYDRKDRTYHQTVATIVAGALQDNFTMSVEHLDALFDCDGSSFYTSISELSPAGESMKSMDFVGDTDDSKEQLKVYKVFSPEPLTPKQLNIIFMRTDFIKVYEWKAYPHYGKIPPDLPPFRLDGQNLFYLNSIEWAASAIEMSLISGKNIALLLERSFTSHETVIDYTYPSLPLSYAQEVNDPMKTEL